MKKVTVLLSLYTGLTLLYVIYGMFFSIEGYRVWHWHLFTSALVVLPMTLFLFVAYIVLLKLLVGGDKDGTRILRKSKRGKEGKNYQSGKNGDGRQAV